ncbi:MAG: tRNA dimethylallyltransferase [Patescibacteria group bacterium]|nr:MAG: tRNA dimethylallyltransferase [Patescibacteria group bacterium]
MPKKICIITGQTATGKTGTALKIAQKTNGALINADARQVYKLIDITTGKDLPKGSKFHLETKINHYDIGYYLFGKVPIYLYDIAHPNVYVSSYDWADLALSLIKKLFIKYNTIVLVGGSYFYLYNLLYKLDSDNIGPDFNLREQLKHKSLDELRNLLEKLNPRLLNQLNNSDHNNPYRLIRKIEILMQQPDFKFRPQTTNKKICLSEKLNNLQIETKIIGLRFNNNKTLEDKIRKRVAQRLEQGAVAEVKKLLSLGYTKTDQGLKTLGVKQILEFLDGKINYEQLKELWIKKEIKYAKKQYMLMKKDSNINWRIIN